MIALAALVLAVGAVAHPNGPDPPAAPRDRENAVELARVCVRRAGAEPERAQKWLRRLRGAAWLPELQLDALRDTGQRESIDAQLGTRYGAYDIDAVRFEARATWHLDRLVFDAEEVRASRESVRLAELRQELALTVVRLYFERRRIEIEDELTPPGPREAALHEVRREEIAAALGAMCGRVPP
jgi:hypothetical protein